MSTLFMMHLFSCFFMTGAIWLVQVLIYPNFKIVGPNEFSKFHQFHGQRITWIVGPMMALELLSAIGLYALSQGSFLLWNLISVAGIWLLTAFVNVPTHDKLSFDIEETKSKLIWYNWPRTIIWTMRSLFLMFYLLSQQKGQIL